MLVVVVGVIVVIVFILFIAVVLYGGAGGEGERDMGKGGLVEEEGVRGRGWDGRAVVIVSTASMRIGQGTHTDHQKVKGAARPANRSECADARPVVFNEHM